VSRLHKQGSLEVPVAPPLDLIIATEFSDIGEDQLRAYSNGCQDGDESPRSLNRERLSEFPGNESC